MFTNTGSGYVGWRIRFLGIYSWPSVKYKNTGSAVHGTVSGKRIAVL